ncbi:putative coil containing protein [Vibrio phage 121E34-1]|nr:putative coil containing protein [Vibrio phage 131E34-1]CAH9012159.1 putative coil containing protein [Vibrio phage 121E34-1]
MENQELQFALEVLRDAIQSAEEFGRVYTDQGQLITGAVIGDDGAITLVSE